jgi:hypothetical protein
MPDAVVDLIHKEWASVKGTDGKPIFAMN